MQDILEFKTKANHQFTVSDIVETTPFKDWIGNSIGWSLLEFNQTGKNIYVKIQRVNIDNPK